MINLLADTKKNDLAAARINLILVRYMLIVVLAFAFLAGALFVSYTTLSSLKETADTIIETNSTKTSSDIQASQDAQILESKLAEVQSVLRNEVRYSHILTQLAQSLPSGTVLESFTVDTTAITGQTPVTLKILARSNSEADRILPQLQNSGIFSAVTRIAVEPSDGSNTYPVIATLNVVFMRAGI